MALPAALNVNYDFHPAIDLQVIERDRQLQMDSDHILGQIMPIDFAFGETIMWDQKEDSVGLLPQKPLGAPFPTVNTPGGRRIVTPASHFAAEEFMSSQRIVSAARFGTIGNEKQNVNDWVDDAQYDLASKQFQMMNYQRGLLLSTGNVPILNVNEDVVDTLVVDSFGVRSTTLSGGAKWDTPATATPIDDLRNVHANFFQTTTYDARGGGLALMSPATEAKMFACAQMSTPKNRFGESIIDANEFNDKFNKRGAGEFPRIEVCMGNSWLKSLVLKPFIPDGYVVIVGEAASRGLICGNWVITSNESALGQPIIFAETDTMKDHPKLPRTVRSVAGGVRLKSLKQIAVLKVY